MNRNRLTIQDIIKLNESEGTSGYKFVKVGDEYRFNVFDGFASHSDLLTESEIKSIESAGRISIRKDSWTMEDDRSMMLSRKNQKACSDQKTIDELSELIGKPHLFKWER